MKVGDLLLLNEHGVDDYGVTSCIFLGYKKAFGVKYVTVFIKGREIALHRTHLKELLNESR